MPTERSKQVPVSIVIWGRWIVMEARHRDRERGEIGTGRGET